MDTSLTLPTKEVEQVNKEVVNLQTSAHALVIKTPDDLSIAADLMSSIKQAEKVIMGRKEDITRPLMRGLASVRDLFKPIELGIENARKVVKAKIIAFQTEEEARADSARAKLAARVEKGTLRADTAARKMGEIEDMPKTVQGSAGRITTRLITKVRIVDETSIPREYLVPDMKAITEAVLKAGITIPGVETYQEKSIASIV